MVLIIPLLYPAILSNGLQTGPEQLETSLLGGFVFDKTTKVGLANFTAEVEREHFIGRQTTTRPDGYYQFNLSAGHYTIKVFSDLGQLLLEEEFDLLEGQKLKMDLPVDKDVILLSRIHGTILDRDGEKVPEATVRVNRERPKSSNSTSTSDNGNYQLLMPPGVYSVEVFYRGELEYNKTVSFHWGEDLELNLTLTGLDVEKTFSLQDVLDFVLDNWINLLVLLITILLILLAYLGFLGVQRRFKKHEKKFLDTEWFISGKKLVQRVILIIVASILVRQFALMSPGIDEYVWSWYKVIILPLLGIVFVLFLMRVALFWTTRFWEYFGSQKDSKGDNLIPKEFISLLEPISKYLIMFLSGIVILVIGLFMIGLKEQISHTSGDFFTRNASKIIFLVVLIVIAIFLKRFIDTFFKEVSSKAKKVSPQMLDMSRKGTFGITYFALALIFMFTLLSIAGLGDIGTTFLLVISMIVGLVVSFAATGSIGNMLSGLVLISMKPFEVGDRVQLGDSMIGDVENIGIMFTRIRDLEGRLLEIPNNNILQNNLANFSASARGGGFAVFVDSTLGYDIAPKKARELMIKASLMTPGVLIVPAPYVLVRSFMNHCVEYRLRAFTDNPRNMASIRSTVMENMMDLFHGEGLEIMSPLTVFELHREDWATGTRMSQLSRVDRFREDGSSTHPPAE